MLAYPGICGTTADVRLPEAEMLSQIPIVHVRKIDESVNQNDGMLTLELPFAPAIPRYLEMHHYFLAYIAMCRK